MSKGTIVLKGNTPLDEMPIRELYVRRSLCDRIIRELNEMNDPRVPDAREYYVGELQSIDAVITRKEAEERRAKGIPDPEPVVVGLKPAVLFGEPTQV